jgi:hypothetical protein
LKSYNELKAEMESIQQQMLELRKSELPSVSKAADFKNFTKYTRRQTIARFLAQVEIFKLVQNVKGSIVECGVHEGGGVFAWANLSVTLEPYMYQRKIIGFDTFHGFPETDEIDRASVGDFSVDYDIYSELKNCIIEFDSNRFLNHIEKIELVKGDANVTIPKYIEKNQHLLVSLLYLDFDLYKPTKTALEHFLPRMPRGSVIAFDEVNNPQWAGETMALLETLHLKDSELKSFSFEPNISYIKL